MINDDALDSCAKVVSVHIVVPHGSSGGDQENHAVVEEERVEKLQE